MAKWTVSMKKADFNEKANKFHIDPVVARIMRNRDIITDEEYQKFLHGSMADLYAPWDMKDMDRAVEIIFGKIQEKAKIRVIGDYDVDGVCSSYILETGLRSLGADVDTVIPHRMKDGYGLNMDLLQEALEDGVDTVVTCDNGISARDPIAYAKEQGMTIVVTDHHEVPYKEENGIREYLVPLADAVVDPKQEDCHYPFSGICGGVVAYKLIQALYEKAGVDYLTESYLAIPYFENKYKSHKPQSPQEFLEALGVLEFAALATICDVMELRDENRILVKYGLEAVKNTENLGLKALLEVSELAGKDVSVYHAGFILGPCVNATGRLDTAMRGLDLFRAEAYRDAMMTASELKNLNESRKAMTLKGLEAAVAKIEEEHLEEQDVLVVFLPDCHESLAGIIAGRIREKYHKPAIVLTRGEEGVKGSGRSIDAYHMYEKLCECSDLLSKFGGHKLAAGLSLEEEKVEAFRQRLNENSGLTAADFEEKVLIDVPMPLSYVSESFIENMAVLEPFGTGNPKPVFAQKNVTFLSGRKLGQQQNVGKFTVRDENGISYEVMLFDNLPGFDEYVISKYGETALDMLYMGRGKDVVLSITYFPGINEFRGKKSLQFVMSHYV